MRQRRAACGAPSTSCSASSAASRAPRVSVRNRSSRDRSTRIARTAARRGALVADHPSRLALAVLVADRSSRVARTALVADRSSQIARTAHLANRSTRIAHTRARRGALVVERRIALENRASRFARASLGQPSSGVVHLALLDENRSICPYLWRLLGGERDSSQCMRRVPTRYDLRVTLFFASDLVPRRCADNVSGKLHAFVRVTCLHHPQSRR